MSNFRKLIIIVPALVFVLACSLVSRPLQKVEDVGGTAAALATQAGDLITQAPGLVTEAVGMATEIAPLETLAAAPTSDGDQSAGNIFDPKAPPLKEWKGIPIMSDATAGEEAEGMYGYKVDATPEKIQSFYVTRMAGLGWDSLYNMPYADGVGLMMFSNGPNTLSITISEVNGSMLVLLNMQ